MSNYGPTKVVPIPGTRVILRGDDGKRYSGTVSQVDCHLHRLWTQVWVCFDRKGPGDVFGTPVQFEGAPYRYDPLASRPFYLPAFEAALV